MMKQERSMTTELMCQIVEGLMPTEKIALVESADGRIEEVLVSPENLSGGKLLASEIGRDGDRVLVELPRESTSGHWRMWVNATVVSRA